MRSALAVCGILIADTNNNTKGRVILSGRLEKVGLSTTPGLNNGDILYVGKDGSLTNNVPEVGVNNFETGDVIVKVGVICANNDDINYKDFVIRIDIVGQL
jgi:hypothetical protein